MGPKIGLNLHAKSLKRHILGAQLGGLKPPKKLQLTLLKAPPIEPTCLIYGNWGRGKTLKHGVPKKKREVAKKPKRAPKFGFFEPKNQKRAPNLGFFCQKSQREPDFWQKSFWILPPSVWTPRHKNPAAWTYMPEMTFLLEPMSFFLESNFELSLLKPKFWKILPLKIFFFAPRFPM